MVAPVVGVKAVLQLGGFASCDCFKEVVEFADVDSLAIVHDPCPPLL